MINNPALKTIKERRSRRKFNNIKINDEQIKVILDSGIWAPSGLNNQPWRFAVINDPIIKSTLAKLTKYSRVIDQSDKCICVFYHIPSGYNRDKDLMSIGACVENMLIAAEAIGLGAVWLGEILNNSEKVNELIDVPLENELCAVIALGYSNEVPESTRKSYETFILK